MASLFMPMGTSTRQKAASRQTGFSQVHVEELIALGFFCLNLLLVGGTLWERHMDTWTPV